MKRVWIQAVAALTLAAPLAHAQDVDSAKPKTFFRARDGKIAAGFLGATAALSIFDVRLEHFFQDTMHLHVREGEKLDKIFTHINETTLTVGGLATYAIGRLTRNGTVADVGFHVAESVAAASLSSQAVRGPLGRTRPRDTEDKFNDQYEFHFLEGFTNFKYRSFPSIHSSSGFAAASALVAEVKRRAPGAVWPVAIPAYLLALTPGLSRIYLGQHWVSDIFAGAFLGTFYGWRIVGYSHTHPTTRIDRIFLGSRSRGPELSWRVTF